MPVLGRATLELNADSAKLEADLGRVIARASFFGVTVGQVVGQGISAAISHVIEFTRGALELGDELNKLSQKVGIAVERLSELRVASALANVPLEALKIGLKELAVHAAAADAKGEEAANAFEAMGVSVTTAGGQLKSMDQLFTEVAAKMSQYEDSAQKSALATALFGKRGVDLIPLMNEVSKTSGLARELGLVMGKDAAEASTRFKDNLTVAHLATEAMGARIATVLLPALEKLSGYLVENAKNTERLDMVARAADAGLKLLATAGLIVAAAFSVVADKVAAAFATASLVLKGEFSEAAKVAAGTVANTGRKIGETAAEIHGVWESTAAQVQAGAEKNGAKLAAPAIEATKRIKAAREAADVEFQAFLKIHAIEEEVGAATQAYYRTIGQQIESNTEEMRKQAEAMETAYAWALDAQRKGVLGDDENVATRIGEVGRQVKQTDDFARQMGLTFSSAFEEAVLGGKKLSDVLKGLAQDIERIILRKTITEPIGNAISGWLSGSGLGQGLGGWLKNLLPSFDVGTDYVPRDMVAQIHQGEQIVPAGAARGNVTVVQHIKVDARSDMGSIMAAMRSARDQAVAAIEDRQLRGFRV